jgi:ParB-like chromosome segregation protein Spo0J
MASHEKECEAKRQLEHEGQPFEIVDGECRWRGSSQLEAEGDGRFEYLPCHIVEVDDLTLAKRRMAANVARNDLNPIEEARGFADIIKLEAAQGRTIGGKFTASERSHAVRELAGEIGCSVKRLLDRLTLLNLPAEVAEGVANGTVPTRTAELIGALPTEEMRLKATKAILHPAAAVGPLPVRAARLLIQTEFAKDLRKAEFSKEDAELVPIEEDERGQRTGGGACTECPLRAGNSPEIYGEDTHPDLCMNPGCYARKEAAKWERWQAEQTKPEKNRRAVTREEFETMKATGDGRETLNGREIVRLVDRPAETLMAEGQTATWKQVVKGADVPVIVVPDAKGRPVEYVDKDLAIAAATTAKNPVLRAVETAESPAAFRESANEEEHRDATLRKQKEQQAARAEVEEKERAEAERLRKVIDALSRGKVIPADVWLVMGQVLIPTIAEHGDAPDLAVARGRAPEDVGEAESWLHAHFFNRPEPQKIGFVFECVLMCSYKDETPEHPTNRDGWVEVLAEALGIDLAVKAAKGKKAAKKAEASPAEEASEAEKPEASEAAVEEDIARDAVWVPLAEGMIWRCRPKDRGFVFNEHRVCENPDELELALPPKIKGSVVLRVARVSGVPEPWRWAVDVVLPEMGAVGAGVHAECVEGPGYATKFGALAAAASEVSMMMEGHRKLKGAQEVVKAAYECLVKMESNALGA